MTYTFIPMLKHISVSLIIICMMACTSESKQDHIVFVIGDEEYRSEESMPMLSRLAEKELGVKVSLCFSTDSLGIVDPNRLDHISGLEALADADLMVMFTRFRALPDHQLKPIMDFVNSAKPVVGFRTSTHAFLYKTDSTKYHMNNTWPADLFGQQWITHHGHFDDGNSPLTKINKRKDHSILNGVSDFVAYSWLYHVEGGGWNLQGDCDILLDGTSLRSSHEEGGRLEKFPLTNPVAWTKNHLSNSNEPSRVFFTTLGHPYDFKNENMRRLALQGIAWALSREKEIPTKGFSVNLDQTFEPNNSGFGKKYKLNKKPEEF